MKKSSQIYSGLLSEQWWHQPWQLGENCTSAQTLHSHPINIHPSGTTLTGYNLPLQQNIKITKMKGKRYHTEQ